MPGRKAPGKARRDQILKAAYEVAARHGLEGMTVRLVAARARLSTGLVLFHFRSKDQLVLALLEWLLETTTMLRVGPDILAVEAPLGRLLALLRQEMDRLSREPRRMRLFFEFWALGGHHPTIGTRMRTELLRYRKAFRPFAEAVLESDPEWFRLVTADGLASVAVSFIKGCAVQSMIDPTRFDIEEYLMAAEGLLGKLGGNGTNGTRQHSAARTARPSARRARGSSSTRRGPAVGLGSR